MGIQRADSFDMSNSASRLSEQPRAILREVRRLSIKVVYMYNEIDNLLVHIIGALGNGAVAKRKTAIGGSQLSTKGTHKANTAVTAAHPDLLIAGNGAWCKGDNVLQ